MTPDQIRNLKAHYGTNTEDALIDLLKCSRSELRRVAAQLCLGKDKKRFPVARMPRWRAEESATLRQLYATTSNEEIARQVNRTVKSVVAKAHNLGLRKDPARLREMGQQNVKLRRDRQ